MSVNFPGPVRGRQGVADSCAAKSSPRPNASSRGRERFLLPGTRLSTAATCDWPGPPAACGSRALPAPWCSLSANGNDVPSVGGRPAVPPLLAASLPMPPAPYHTVSSCSSLVAFHHPPCSSQVESLREESCPQCLPPLTRAVAETALSRQRH